MPANPISAPGEWQVFRVAGVACPGIATVSGCVDSSKLDVQAGSGTKGATVNYKGGEPKAFKVELHFLEAEDLDAWDTGQARQIIEAPPTGKNPKAFAVDHPACQYAKIGAALKQSVSAPEPVGDGSWKVTIDLMPATPPKPSSGTPKGSSTQWTNKGSKDAKTEAEKTLDELEKQAAAA